MSREQQTILGLFSSPSPLRTGGVERSGGIAWQGIVDHIGEDQAQLCCYERNKTISEKIRSISDEKRAYAGEVASSKIGAILMALRQRARVDTILIWHLHLLRLLPFLHFSAAQVIVFLHGIEAWKPLGWTARALLRRVDLFLTNSDYTWARFLVDNPTFRTTPHRTVHLGIGTPLDTTPEPPLSPPAALMIGRLARGEDYKGHREMIAAWPAVRQRVPTAELWIVGDGDLRPDIEALVSTRGTECGTRFFGRVSDEEKERLLRRCRVMALPSRGEGFGLVYLEAMRMGRPCLVSTCDAGREVVNPPEAGLSVEPHDQQAVVDAICHLLTPGHEWEGWSLRARQRYEQHFAAAHFQRRLVEALACS
jgi:phosphatidylinositol alpha-1,6-mannosyltransferase